MTADFKTSDFKQRLNEWLERYRFVLIVILAALILAILAIFVFDYLNDRNTLNSSLLAEEIREKYRVWIEEEAEDRDDEKLNELIKEGIETYPKHFASQRAIYTKGLMAFEKKKWEDAAKNFIELAEKWPESYLAPISLSDAAASFEEAANNEEAVNTLRKLVENYSDISPEAPEALFNLGRLAENAKNNDKAIKKYEDLVSKFPSSRWHSLAKSRIVVLKAL